MKRIVPFLLALGLQAQDYDLLIKNGTVIDPKNGINAKRDVAIKDRKIAEVAPSIAAAKAHKVVDATGMYVTPGFMDIHVHVYSTGGGRSYTGDLSVWPDGHTLRSGVTTVVDAGTSGWRTFEHFKETIIDRSKTRVLSMLNIVGKGMAGNADIEQDMNDMDAKATAAMAKKHPETIVGVKTAHFTGPSWTAVERAVQAGTEANIPVMVDFGTFRPERPFPELIMNKLRPGDIYTHFYLGAVPLVDDKGKVQPYMFEARKRGVLFDVGHGGGSFVWRQASAAMKQGLPPDSISTDLHVGSMVAGMKDMTNVMSKFLLLGMKLEEVVKLSTWNPAKEMKRADLGHLSVGAGADVAVFKVRTGSFGFTDVYGAKAMGTQKIEVEMTLRDGMVQWDLNGITRESWDKLGPKYESQSDPKWDGTLSSGRRRRP